MVDAVVLLSGGVDSATALAWAVRKQGWRAAAISFDYGQRHRAELDAARRVAEALGARPHRMVRVDLAAIGGSALTEKTLTVPKTGYAGGIPITYVPGRNMIFLALAASLAEVLGCTRLVIGANVVDYSGYPDCRPEFLDAMAEAITRGTKIGAQGQRWRIEAPLLRLTKADIVRLGLRLGLDYGLTHSCYDPDDQGRACGWCDACRFRAEGFAEAGV
ncbi:MAG: 7-cyano-7-deazaguanine synthase QueC, partial [Zetaproteobacteria bacterium]